MKRVNISFLLSSLVFISIPVLGMDSTLTENSGENRTLTEILVADRALTEEERTREKEQIKRILDIHRTIKLTVDKTLSFNTSVKHRCPAKLQDLAIRAAEMSDIVESEKMPYALRNYAIYFKAHPFLANQKAYNQINRLDTERVLSNECAAIHFFEHSCLTLQDFNRLVSSANYHCQIAIPIFRLMGVSRKYFPFLKRHPLHVAVLFEDEDGAEKFAKVTSELDSWQHLTAFELAARYNKINMLKVLIAYVSENNKNNALHRAIENDAVDAIEWLVRHGNVDINAIATTHRIVGVYEEYTTLQKAVVDAAYSSLIKLLALGADINKANSRGETALHSAVRRDRVPFVKLLLANGANPNALTHDGKTPRDYLKGSFTFRDDEGNFVTEDHYMPNHAEIEQLLRPYEARS